MSHDIFNPKLLQGSFVVCYDIPNKQIQSSDDVSTPQVTELQSPKQTRAAQLQVEIPNNIGRP